MQHVDVKVHEEIATIVLDRPQVRNALSPGLLEDLNQAFSDVHQEKRVRAVVLTGAGSDFCSGLDLGVLKEINELPESESLAQSHQYWRQWAESIEVVLRFPKPVVAAVDGLAAGAGLSLALASDLMVLSHGATLSAPAIRHGLVGGITASLLAFRHGGALASQMALSGDAMNAEAAVARGIACHAVDSEQIWVAACDWARRCTQGPAAAIQATKRVINESIGEALISQISAAAAAGAAGCSHETAAQGIQAFVEKTDPQWHG
ncbi:enoyl-CoA hydratase/isomerase family protein [Crateriforma conspicua]|uniref:2,3-dehydroadipyl-CoA hydratase n=1 Tax=Crateriforma conspicua TaxID=2527996 RepID=A0A5C6FRV1_9PLAN|nr:enoyl-CoA hydratase/isomerase family protein [Crateriforma conspicua]TWU63213.1 2,3-dehydroadipyl-CoA hydratase [Crateriforma conspicua]